ncbi:MAG: phage terminase large subunit family protein, partial [Alteromonadaceae bacterium]|nr:phage terminase large subunit family protein [Alteromonadaceae bacterium]
KNTDIYKDYGGAQWDYLGAATSNHLMALTKQVIFVDEYTRIKQDPGNEGSLRTLFKRRLTGAPFPTLVVGSSPGIQGEDDLEVMMEEMDVRLQMNLPCPFCHEEQTLKWGGPECDIGIYFDKEGSKDERAASTRYEESKGS